MLLFYELPDQRKDSSVSLLSLHDLQKDRAKSSSLSSLQGDHLPPSIQESIEEESVSPPQPPSVLASVTEEAPSPVAPKQAPARSTSNPHVMELETDREFEMAELKRRNSMSQNIFPVSAAIAMYPRTISMNSVPREDEYDVQFGDDTVILGMYLEKIAQDLCVTSFPRGVHGELFGAEKSGQIGLFDLVMQANGHPLQHYQVDRALKMIKAQSRPLIVRFRRSPRVAQLIEMGFTREMACDALSQCQGDVQAAANKCFEMQH